MLFYKHFFMHSVLKLCRYVHPGSLPTALSHFVKHMKTLNTLKNRAMLSAITQPAESRFHGCDHADTSLTSHGGNGPHLTTRGHQHAICGKVVRGNTNACLVKRVGEKLSRASVVHSVLPEHTKINVRLNPRIEPAPFSRRLSSQRNNSSWIPCVQSVHLYGQDLEF